jgi:hypothetical protein
MHKVSRSKKTAPRSRCASPQELAEDRRRFVAAKPSIFATVEEFEAFCEGSQPRETVAALRADEPDVRQRVLDGLDVSTALNLGASHAGR